MKGRRIIQIYSIALLGCIILLTQNVINSSSTLPSVSGDDGDERIIHLGGGIIDSEDGVDTIMDVYFNETLYEQGYFYQLSYSINFEIIEATSRTVSLMVIGWTVGTEIYSYITFVDIPEGKQGFFNFSTYEPISSCFACGEGFTMYWISEDHESIVNSLYDCALLVEDIFSFEFTHYFFTDYAIYAIHNDVTFCPVVNQTMGPGLSTAYGSIQWEINRVARFNSDPDTIIGQLNVTPHFCFSAGYGQEWTSTKIVLDNLTDGSGNGVIESGPGSATPTDSQFPHQVYYEMDINSGNLSTQTCIDIGFVPPDYFSSQSDWKLLPGWAKFTIIGGSISLIGCGAFIVQNLILFLKKRKLG